jgi:hypothetical protein
VRRRRKTQNLAAIVVEASEERCGKESVTKYVVSLSLSFSES